MARVSWPSLASLNPQACDVGRRAFWRAHAEPHVHLVAWDKLAHGWEISQCLQAHRAGYRESAQLTGPDERDRRGSRGEYDFHLCAEHACKCGSGTAKRHVDHVDASPHLQQFAGEMAPAPNPGRPHVDLARIGFGIGDEFGNRLSWNRWIDHHHERPADDACDRCDVTDEVEVELLVEGRVDRTR